MRVAIGLKAHSGWAALVVVGFPGRGVVVVDRRRIELVAAENVAWGKQPYHAAENLQPAEARRLVERAIKAAHRLAAVEMRAVVQRARSEDHEIVACAVLVPSPMPEWSVEQILAVHFRMHKAEGVLFPSALVEAARACNLKVVEVPEKELGAKAEYSPPANATKQVLALGRSVGPPWGKDQKSATFAAMIAFGALTQ